MADPPPSGIQWKSRPAFNGGALSFAEVGVGPPVLLLHGLNASTHVFAQLIERAQPRYRLLSIDLPCSGRSGRFGPMHPRVLAREVASFIGSLHLGKVMLVGHSFGGLVALELAVAFPSLVSSLLLTGAPALGFPALTSIVSSRAFEKAWLRIAPLLRSPKLAHAYLRLLWGNEVPFTHRIAQAYVDAAAHAEAPLAWLEAIRAVSAYEAPWRELAKCAVPRAVIWGGQDRLVPRKHGLRLAEVLNVPLVVLPDVGHFVPEETPEQLVAEMDKLTRERQKEEVEAARHQGASEHGG